MSPAVQFNSPAPAEEKDTRFSVTLPTELYEKVAAKAEFVGANMDKTIEVLLRHGLAVQITREAELRALVDKAIAAADAAEREAAGQRLSEMAFGR